MSEHIHKRHNKNLLLYHLVCPIKYRRNVLSEEVEKSLVEVCINIESRFEIFFIYAVFIIGAAQAVRAGNAPLPK